MKTYSTNYGKAHRYLHVNYGKADHCENTNCPGTSKTYDWALKKGYRYECNRDNFMQLCRSCHKIYDYDHITVDCQDSRILHNLIAVDTISERLKSIEEKKHKRLTTRKIEKDNYEPNKRKEKILEERHKKLEERLSRK